MPKALCGTTVNGKLLAPLLPPGKKLTQQSEEPADGITHCKLSIDGKGAFVTTQEWWDTGTRPLQVAKLQPNMESGDMEVREQYAYSDTGAAGRVTCPAPKKPDDELFAVARVLDDRKVDKGAVEKFFKNYSEHVQSTDQCSK